MFSGLWPGFDPEEVPITSVTNGVHAPTWVAPEVFRLGARQIGAQRTEDALTVGGSDRWDAVADIADQEIWDLRRALREQLVLEVRDRLRAPGASAAPARPNSAGSTACSTPTSSPSASRAASPRTNG